MKKKVLLMGASGSGKTSMRSVIFSNNPASLTSRLGATLDVEQNHVRFLGDLVLNLWDCGGQDSFMDSYLTTQKATIFSNVGVLIYVVDIDTRNREQERDKERDEKDLGYYKDCLDALSKYSPEASVFVLIHKMDLVRTHDQKRAIIEKRTKDLEARSDDTEITVFGTSIYDESLYKAWSRIVHSLIPNATILSKHLTIFAEACSAVEVILFERTTFLVIATSEYPPTRKSLDSGLTSPSFDNMSDLSGQFVHSTRYERTSELIKAFKHSCTRMREEFHALEMQLPEFTAVLDELTKNTYIMVVVHDPTIEAAAIKINIRLARSKFEELQADSMA